MKLITIPFRNIFGNPGRSLAFGSFLFFASIVSIFLTCFTMTIKDNFENSLINTITGHIQVASAKSEEKDMGDMNRNTQRLDAVDYIGNTEITAVEKILGQNNFDNFTKRVRHAGVFISDADKEAAMIIGLDPESKEYRHSFKLIKGRYLDPGIFHEVIISEELAGNLKVGIGDDIGVFARTMDGYTADSALTIAGIGNRNNSGAFKVNLAYMSLKSAQELKGFQNDEITDIIVYIDNKNNAEKAVAKLNPEFQKSGLSGYVKLSTWKGMGGLLMSLIRFFVLLSYCFIVILMLVISVLLVNIVFMIGFERRRETGTIRAIGFSRSRTLQLFVCEISIISLFFCGFGAAAGAALVSIFGRTGISFKDIMWVGLTGEQFFLKFYTVYIIPALVIIIGFAFLASLYAAYKATSMKPADTLKEI